MVRTREILRKAAPPEPSGPKSGDIDTVVFPTDAQILSVGIRESTAKEHESYRAIFGDWLRLRALKTPVEAQSLKLHLLWFVFLGYEGTCVLSVVSALLEYLVTHNLFVSSPLINYQIVYMRKKVSRSVILRNAARAPLLLKETLEGSTGLTKVLPRLWLSMGIRTHSLCGIHPEHISLPHDQPFNSLDPHALGSITVAKDKAESVGGRAAPVPCACARGASELCPLRTCKTFFPLDPPLLEVMLKQLRITLRSIRRTVAMALRALLHEGRGDFGLPSFLFQVGWSDSGASWNTYTEDFNPKAHTLDSFPDMAPRLIAIGSRLSAENKWEIVRKGKGVKPASGFKFKVRKKAQKDRIQENKTRFKLPKEEMAHSPAQQVELGVATEPIPTKVQLLNRTVAETQMTPELPTEFVEAEAMEENGDELADLEKKIVEEIGEIYSYDEH